MTIEKAAINKQADIKAQAKALRRAANALELGLYTNAIRTLNKTFGGLTHLLHDHDQLPPLPEHNGEPEHTDNAQYALRALTQYAKDTAAGEMDNALCDFLADAMHLCNLGLLKDSNGDTQDFDGELERGRSHYNEETAQAEKPCTCDANPESMASCERHHNDVFKVELLKEEES